MSASPTVRQLVSEPYIHGYSAEESSRLVHQADALRDLIHGGTHYPVGSRVLEAGCGVGAQTVHLATRSPGARVTSIDVSRESVAEAQERVRAAGLTNVTVQLADAADLPFDAGSFDHVFVCFVLEHASNPIGLLRELRRVLAPGGSLTVFEPDVAATFFHPSSAAAEHVVECFAELQRRSGGDPTTGRKLLPLLKSAGYQDARVEPRPAYADGNAGLVDRYRAGCLTMIGAVGPRVVEIGLMNGGDWDLGMRELSRIEGRGGVLYFPFFKAVAFKAGERMS